MSTDHWPMRKQSLRTPELTDHPLYRRVLGHLQQGEWPEAITLLHQLRALYPSDSEVRATIAEVELKAALDQSQPAASRAWRQTVLRPLKLALAVLILVAAIGFAVNLYQQQVQPVLARNRLAAEVAKLVQEGQQAYLAGNLDLAAQRFQAALALAPTNAAAQQGVRDVETTRTLAQQYTEAVALMDAGRLDEAWNVFAAISQVRSSYRDVASRLETIDRALAAQELFDQAEAAYAAGDWLASAAAYEDLRARDANFERDQVRRRLFDSYFNQGLALAAEAKDNPEALKRAADYFDKALRVQPQEPRATVERRLARAYLAGSEAAAKGDWERALPQLEIVFKERLEYAGKPIGSWLVQGYLAQAEAALQAGDATGANQKFQQALDVAHQVGPTTERLVLQDRLKWAEVAFQAKDNAMALQGYQQVLEALTRSPVELDVSPTDIRLKAADAAATYDLVTAVRYAREALVALLDQSTGGTLHASARQHLEQADKAIQTGDYATALDEYRRGIEAVRGGKP